MKWKWLYPKFFIHEGVVILEPVAIINKQKRLRHAVIILRSYTRRDNWPLLSQIRNHVQLIGKLRIGTAAHQFWAVNFSFWIWPILHENRKQDLKGEIGVASFISAVGCHLIKCALFSRMVHNRVPTRLWCHFQFSGMFMATNTKHRFQQSLLEMRLMQVNIKHCEAAPDLRSQTIYGFEVSSNSSLISVLPVNHN